MLEVCCQVLNLGSMQPETLGCLMTKSNERKKSNHGPIMPCSLPAIYHNVLTFLRRKAESKLSLYLLKIWRDPGKVSVCQSLPSGSRDLAGIKSRLFYLKKKKSRTNSVRLAECSENHFQLLQGDTL